MESSGSENQLPRESSPDSDFRDLLREISRSNERKENDKLIEFNKIDSKFYLKNFTEEVNSLNKLKSETKKIELESNIVDHRLDNYVRDLFRENQGDSQFNQDLGRIIRQPTVAPRQLLPRIRRETFLHHGLSARSIQPEFMRVELKVNGDRVLVDKEYTHIDFMPEGRRRREPSKTTNSIANAIKGLTGLVAAIDAGEVALEPVFVGTININMALISQRFGFRIVDTCRNPDGTINKSKTSFTVVGRLEDVRQKLVEFAQSGLYQRILQRDARQRRTLQPAK